jgi:hypothetical protein
MDEDYYTVTDIAAEICSGYLIKHHFYSSNTTINTKIHEGYELNENILKSLSASERGKIYHSIIFYILRPKHHQPISLIEEIEKLENFKLLLNNEECGYSRIIRNLIKTKNNSKLIQLITIEDFYETIINYKDAIKDIFGKLLSIEPYFLNNPTYIYGKPDLCYEKGIIDIKAYRYDEHTNRNRMQLLLYGMMNRTPNLGFYNPLKGTMYSIKMKESDYDKLHTYLQKVKFRGVYMSIKKSTKILEKEKELQEQKIKKEKLEQYEITKKSRIENNYQIEMRQKTLEILKKLEGRI